MGYGLSGYSALASQPVGNPRFEQLIKSELALTAWRYGREYGSHVASVMIMHCLRNRFTKGWGPWLQILENVPKFSATLEQPQGMPDQWDRSFVKVLSETDGVVDSTSKDISNKALYFGDLVKANNPWFIDSIARNPDRQRVADMNTLVFWN